MDNQYPTPEQIADVIGGSIVAALPTDPDVIRAADAVLALFPQPTPSEEPVCGGSSTNCIHRFRPPIHTMACPVGQAQNHYAKEQVNAEVRSDDAHDSH